MTAPRPITDEALVAFVMWCRLNDPRFVLNPVIARRVFEAYRRVPPLTTKAAS